MAKWIEDPQGRLEVEKVTEELKLPVWKPNYKGKFREFWNECWEKIENAYLKLKKSIDGKEPAITKKSGFNLEKTDSFEEDDTNKLATAKALKSLHDEVDKKTGAIKLNWDSITDKPSSFPPSEHNHNSLYYTEDEVDEKLENNILYSTGKTYGGVLNEIGLKEAGKTYFDKNTKKLYLCKNNNTDISANINNYIAMDSHSILERLENLSTFKIQEMYSTPAGVKFTIFQYGNLLMINAHTHNIEKILYGVSYSCNLPYNCYNTSAAITGNNGSSGHFTLDNNILAVNSTDSRLELRNTFMGQLTTFLK